MPGRAIRRFARWAIAPFAIVVSASMLCATLAAAQGVHGTARAGVVGGNAAPSGETSIVLVDTAGHIVSGAVTDASGHYALRAPSAATYRVVARHVGFAPDSSALLALHGGESVIFDPVLRAFPSQLASVRVDVADRCRIAPDASALARQLWEDAQSALTATVIGGSDARTSFLLRRFERQLDSAGRTVEASRTWDAVTTSSEPYESIAAESLAAHGFVVPEGSSLTYYAPDARTLISDVFARDHCFQPVERGDHPGQIGLAFTPTERVAQQHADVSGALWIERATGRLVDLELTYATPPGLGGSPVPATARVDYAQTDGGRWIVQHWVLRMPVVRLETVMAPRDASTLTAGTVLKPVKVPTLSAIWEAGGDVVRTITSVDTLLDAFGSVHGRFIDTASASGAAPRVEGVPGVRVALEALAGGIADARYAAVSDSTGAFAVDNVRPGQYRVRVTGDVLDTLTASVAPREITVAAAMSQTITTTLPSAESALRTLCPQARDDEAVVHGVVKDRDGRHVAQAKVVISWFDVADQRQSHFAASTHTLAGLTDANGAYVICGAPRGHPLTVRATKGAMQSNAEALEASRAPIRMAELEMPKGGATR